MDLADAQWEIMQPVFVESRRPDHQRSAHQLVQSLLQLLVPEGQFSNIAVDGYRAPLLGLTLADTNAATVAAFLDKRIQWILMARQPLGDPGIDTALGFRNQAVAYSSA